MPTIHTYANGLVMVSGQPTVPRGQYNAVRDQANLFDQTETVASGSWLGLRHTALLGFEVGRQELATTQFTGTVPPVALYNPVLTRPIYTSVPSTLNNFRGTVFGAYMQDQISWRRWKALVSLRRDRYRQTLDNQLPGAVDLARIDGAWSPRAGLVYSITNWASAYASVSKTFDPSGEALSLATNNADLKPEQSRNLELGFKSELLGRRLTMTVAAFRLDRTNIKTTDPVDPLKLVLVGAQRTDGAELSFSGNPWRRLEIIGGYAWLDPVIRRSNTVTSGVRVEGNQGAFIPRQGGSLWATYSWESGFGVSAGAFAAARRFTSNDNLVALPGYVRIDAALFYRARHWSISVNLRNILDRTYYETAQSNFQIYPGAPANGLVTLRYRW
jgi:catecholate siderophore receptor